MSGQSLMLMGRAVRSLGEAQNILGALVSHGVLSSSWGEIRLLIQSIQAELIEIENGYFAPTGSQQAEEPAEHKGAPSTPSMDYTGNSDHLFCG